MVGLILPRPTIMVEERFFFTTSALWLVKTYLKSGNLPKLYSENINGKSEILQLDYQLPVSLIKNDSGSKSSGQYLNIYMALFENHHLMFFFSGI